MMNAIPDARALAFAALLFTLPPLVAQEPAVDPDVEQLVVETSKDTIAMALTRGEAPVAKAGEHYKLTLGDDGEWECTTVSGTPAALVTIRARPAKLMATFAEQVDQAREMAQMGATMSTAGSPMGPELAGKVIAAMFDFPAQLDLLTVTVKGDEASGYDAHAEMVPIAKGWLASAVAGLKPSGKGVHTLAGDVMALAFDIHPDGIGGLADWGFDFALAMAKKDQRDELRKTMGETWKMFDGTGAFAWHDGRLAMAYGCADPQKVRAMFLGEDWLKMQRALLAQQPDAEFAVTREKVGDLDVLSTTAELGDLPENPLFPDGKVTAHSCVAGDLVLTTMNGKQEALLELVTRTTGDNAKRAPLAGDALMTMKMNLLRLVELNEDMQDADTSEMPESVELRFGKKGEGVLTLDVRVKM